MIVARHRRSFKLDVAFHRAYWTIVTHRLLILLVNTDPRNVEELGAPFYYAAVAAAMDYEVDVLCTATAGKLMFSGVAERLTIKQGDPMTVYGWIKEAHGAGRALLGLPRQS